MSLEPRRLARDAGAQGCLRASNIDRQMLSPLILGAQGGGGGAGTGERARVWDVREGTPVPRGFRRPCSWGRRL